jgi:hypothetical protein
MSRSLPRLREELSVLMLAAAAFWGGSAEASEDKPAAPGGPAQPTTDPATLPLRWRVWPLFDPYASRREWLASFSWDRLRETSALRRLEGFRLAFGESISTLRACTWVGLEQNSSFRALGSSTYVVELTGYRAIAGVHALGLELGGGVGIVPIALDVSQGDWSLSGLSPSAVARAGLRVGPFRVSVEATNQFTWRWWGRDSAWLRGVGLQLALEQPRKLMRGRHPLILEY